MKKKIVAFLLILCYLFGTICLTTGCKDKNPQTPDDNNNNQIEQPNTPSSGDNNNSSNDNVEIVETFPYVDQEQNVALRFSVMSDIHIGDLGTEAKLRKGLRTVDTISDKKLDLMLFNGDLTNTTANTLSNQQIIKFRNAYDRVLYETPFMYTLGPNHDTPQNEQGIDYRRAYESTFGDKRYELNKSPSSIKDMGARHVELKGYNFITLDYDGGYSQGLNPNVINWLRETLTALTTEDADRPIFVLYHLPNISTLNNVLRDYPQVILFTAHVHNSLAREDSISQDSGFTQVHCGGMNYYRVDGHNRFTTNPYLNLGDIYDFAQNLYVQVYEDKTVKIRRIDAFNKAVIGEPWEITPSNRNSYTSARRLTAKACRFDDDATLKIGAVATSGTRGQIGVSFDACTMGDAGPANYYSIELYTKSGGSYVKTSQADVGSQQVFFPNDKNIPKGHYSYTFSDVDVSDYAVVVKAHDCWQTSSNALVYTNGSYQYQGEVGGKVEQSMSARQTLEFKPTGMSATTYSISFASMGVRFKPTAPFTEVKTRCSSHGDTIGTLQFNLYRWNESYEQTLQGTVVDSFTLSSYQGSTVYTIFTDSYPAGDYLINIVTPNYEEGVGLYAGTLSAPDASAYQTYINKIAINTDVYFGWTNLELTTTPYVPLG